MKKTLTKILTLILAVITATAFIGCAENADTAKEENYTNRGYVNITNLKSNGISLFSTGTQTTATTGSVSREIVAVVYPSNAENKLVDWTISWGALGGPIEGADINDYLTVVPESDGSLVAIVTAYQGFEGADAIITCTTRAGGCSAQCLVKYEGAPESLNFVVDGAVTMNIELTAGQSCEGELSLSNALGAVGSKYGTFEIKKAIMQGKIVAEKREIVNGTITSREDVVVNLEDGKVGDLAFTYEDFFTLTIDGDLLKINALKNEASFMVPNAPVRTGTQYVYKAPYYPPQGGGRPSTCNGYILIEDTVSGEQTVLFLTIKSAVTDITLNQDVIVF